MIPRFSAALFPIFVFETNNGRGKYYDFIFIFETATNTNTDQGGQLVQDPSKLPSGPITRSKFKKIQEGFIGLIQKFLLAQAHSVTNQVQAHPIGATLTQFPLWHVSQVNTNYLEADSAH